VLVVTLLDRLARSTRDLLNILDPVAKPALGSMMHLIRSNAVIG
jgi:DNA invertase Pin-like site-specific DNA recombinase